PIPPLPPGRREAAAARSRGPSRASSRGLLGRHHEARDHLLHPRLVEGDVELIPFGGDHAAIAEFAMEDARPRRVAGLARDPARLALDQRRGAARLAPAVAQALEAGE